PPAHRSGDATRTPNWGGVVAIWRLTVSGFSDEQKARLHRRSKTASMARNKPLGRIPIEPSHFGSSCRARRLASGAVAFEYSLAGADRQRSRRPRPARRLDPHRLRGPVSD